MAYFPTSPLDGASVTVNGILYTYNASKGAWKRAVSTLNDLSVAGNITAAGNIIASNITASNNVYITSGIYWAGNGAAFASTTYSNANVASYLLTGAVIGAGSSNVVIGATTQAESSVTGALVVKGGAGIAGNLYVGGNLVVSNVSYEYREIVTTTETVLGNIVAASSQASTSTTTGALVVVGGAGISGNLYIANTGDVSANIGQLFLGNASTQANLGAFQTFSNANAAAQATSINTINANLGAFQTYANANIGTLFLGNASTNANLGAFQTFSNANAAAQATSINTINANLGTLFLGNASTQANLGAFQTYANTRFTTYSNTNVAAYLTQGATIGSGSTTANLVAAATTTSTSTTTGALVVRGGAGIAGNVYTDKVYTTAGIYWASNGVPYGGQFTASASAPVNPPLGAFWYKTTTDVLYEYINDGTTNYWIDIQSPAAAANVVTSTYVGDVYGGNISFTGSITGSVGYLLERANVVTSAPPPVTNLDLLTAPIMYFTSNTTQNITANIRGNSTVTLNSMLATGQSSTFVIFIPNATGYYVNTVKIDNSTVSPYWQGGSTVVGGNANSIDIYTFAVLKIADATFRVFASQVRYQNLGP
jgi:hypothetical protein